MNYLQLVNDFMIETSMDDQISSVLAQLDDGLKATTWIRDAWTEIQRNETWKFRWAEGSFPTVAAQRRYTLAQQNRVAGDKLDRTQLTIGTGRLTEVDYDLVRFSTSPGTPTLFSVRPDESIELYYIPNAIETVNYEYWKAPVVLADDTDTPDIDPDWHKAIVWKAIINYAREQGREWDGLYRAANREFKTIYSDMLIEFLPPYQGKVPLDG